MIGRSFEPRGAAIPAPRDRLALRAAAFSLAAALVVAGTYAVRALTGSGDAPPAVAPGLSGPGAVSVSERDEIERLIRAYEAQVRSAPNTSAFVFLSRLYLAKARVTGDAAAFGKAEAAADAAIARAPASDDALLAKANVNFAAHGFPEALRLAAAVIERDPSRLDAVAIMSDAAAEMGDVGRAAALLASLERAAPGTAAVDVRRSRLAFLSGDVNRARALAALAADEAVQSGVPYSERAFYTSVRARIELDTGNYAAAERLYRESRRQLAGYVPGVFGHARSLAALGRLGEAIEALEGLVSLASHPDARGLLGDLYAATGNHEAAGRQYDAVLAFDISGVSDARVYGRELATFYADHNVRITEAVALATSELRVRRDVYGYDAHAWALFRSGRPADAEVSARAALALGTQDADIWFHAGMIAASLGDRDLAIERLGRALEISPNFDVLLAPVARRALAMLESP